MSDTVKRDLDDAAGRRLWAGLELLDHQIVDCDGLLAGKVDDLELEVPEDGGAPVLTAILSGLGALAGQIGGDAGRWLASVEARVSRREGPATGRISLVLVDRIDEHVTVSVPRAELDSNRAEQWARDVIVDKVPERGVRLSDLLGARVVTSDGRRLGTVHDVLLVQDGPAFAGGDARFRLHGLAVGGGSLGIRIGAVPGHDGPTGLVGLTARLFGHPMTLVPWDAVVAMGDGSVTVGSDEDDRPASP